MRKSNLTVWLLTLFIASMGGVEPSNADVCFIVGGCEKPSINTKDCNKLGYTKKSCDGVKEIVYDTCVSKGEKFVKCTCNPNYYMLTEKPANAAAYDIEECTKVDGKKLYRATCKSDYKYTLSTIAREDGKTNSKQCDTGKTPVADGGICTMLYGNNVNKILYKDCDCNSAYIYKKETPGFSYTGACTYKYGDNADETLYTTVTCDTNNHYQSDACKEPLVEDKAYKHSQEDLTCRTCKCPDRYKYASDKLTGNFAVDGNKCGDLYDDYKCQNGWTKTDCTGDTKYNCETDTNKTYTDVKCYKKTPKCVYADENKCRYAGFELEFYHPLTGSDINVSATCTQGSDQCWYPKFPTCKDVRLKDCELGWDYPQVSVPYGESDGSIGDTCCMADCTVSPINGYNTDGDCKYNLPSTQECKQVTYTNKSEVGGNTFTNLGSKSLTCFVRKDKATCATLFAAENKAFRTYTDLTFTQYNPGTDNPSDTIGKCTYSAPKTSTEYYYYIDGSIGWDTINGEFIHKYKKAVDENGKPLDLSYTDSKTCGKTTAWLNGKVDYKCISQEREGLTCYHLVRKTCEDYAKEKVKSYDYKHDRYNQYFNTDGENEGAKVYDYKTIDDSSYHYNTYSVLGYGLVGYDANEGLGDKFIEDEDEYGYLDMFDRYKMTDTTVGIVCGFSVNSTGGGGGDTPKETFSCFGETHPMDNKANATAASLCKAHGYTDGQPTCSGTVTYENCPCSPMAGTYLKFTCHN